MKRDELLLWDVKVAERVDLAAFDSFTVVADSVFEATTIAEREIVRRKISLVITSVAYAGEAILWPGANS